MEMLAVLAIMGILGIMALVGFRYAMRYHRENESIDQISKTIVGSRTGFLISAYGLETEDWDDNDKLTGYTPYIVPIKNVISAVDFNGKRAGVQPDGYVIPSESFRTLIGADVSVYVDTPYEFSVRMTRMYGPSGMRVCETLLSIPYGQNYVYTRSAGASYIPESNRQNKYTPAQIQVDTEEARELRQSLCRNYVVAEEEPTTSNPNPSKDGILVFVFGEGLGCTSGQINVCEDQLKDKNGNCCCAPAYLDEDGNCFTGPVTKQCPTGEVLLTDGETCCDMNKVTADYVRCCRSYDTPVGNTCCVSHQVADNGQTCCASDEEVVNDACCHWSRASTDEKTKKKVCCPADRTVRENICEIKRCESTNDIYHPDVAFTDSGYPTLVKLGYANILCCKGAYGINGDMLFAHTDGTVDCCPVASSGGNMIFVKDPVYGSQGANNKYTGKSMSLPYGTCQVYVPPVTDEITTTEETTDTDTDTEPEETSTEWCAYVCESNSPGYNEQACDEYCHWIGDPVSNETDGQYDRCCEASSCPKGSSYQTNPDGSNILDIFGQKIVGDVTEYCCKRTPDFFGASDAVFCKGSGGSNSTCCPEKSTCGKDGTTCCITAQSTSGGGGGTYDGSGNPVNTCNSNCCPEGQECTEEKNNRGKYTCQPKPKDPDTDTIVMPDETTPESSGYDETTAPSGGDSEEYPQEPEDPSLDCSGDAYNPGYYMSKFCACCARNSSYNYYCSDCSNPPNSWSDDGEPEDTDSDSDHNVYEDEIAQRCGSVSSGKFAFCECCALYPDLMYEGECSTYCENDHYTRP
jgi:hypothetical protein